MHIRIYIAQRRRSCKTTHHRDPTIRRTRLSPTRRIRQGSPCIRQVHHRRNGVLGCGGILAASQGATNTPPQATQAPAGNTPATGNTPAPTTAPAGNAIGKPVVVNADWTVTLNSVKKSTGSEFDQPKAGNIFLVVNVTLHNTSGSTQSASTLAQWSIRDASGQTYTQDITYGSGPDGTVAANGKIRGNIAYEVPKSVHSFTLQFVADIGSTDLAEWTVHI